MPTCSGTREDKLAEERRRNKVASRIEQFAIELDGIAPRAVMVNYKTFRIMDCPVSRQVRSAVGDFVADVEYSRCHKLVQH